MFYENQVCLETASVACCGTPAGSVSIDVDVLRCRRDVNTPTHHHAYSLPPSTANRHKTEQNWVRCTDTYYMGPKAIIQHVGIRHSLVINTERFHTWSTSNFCRMTQLWAASLIGRNAVTWPLHSHLGWHYNVTLGDVTGCSLNANVRYILRCFSLRLVCFFLASYCKFLLSTV